MRNQKSKQKQLGFELLQESQVKQFGGAHLKNSHAKVKRPITTNRSMHLVLRSTHAKGERSFLRRAQQIQQIVNHQARLNGVKVYKFANGGNHLHLVVLPRSRHAFNAFIRALSGIIARVVMSVERGVAGSSDTRARRSKKLRAIKFWDKRPFTRIIEWGRDYKKTCDYLLQNTLEALGFIPYQPRPRRNSTA